MEFTMVIADDEPVVLKSMEMFIKKEFPGIQVTGLAENGVELKEMLERTEPDLAVIDIRMPGLSGIEVIELMRSKGGRTHFIINTAYSDFEYVKRALDLKIDGYILKPGRREEKIRVISDMCRAVENEKEESRKQTSFTSALDVVNPYLGSEILLSIFSEKCDEENFNVYLNINSIRFHCGCIATFLFRKKGTMGRREINQDIKLVLDGICDFLTAVTSDGIVVMLFLPEFLGKERENNWCAELAGLIAKTLEEHSGNECLYGVGGTYGTFLEMPLSYRESIAKLKREPGDGGLESEHPDKIISYAENAKMYIESNYFRDIALMDCANSVGISPYYLSHIFKEKTGTTFVEYLTAMRMEHAKTLCLNPKITIKDISDRCGYINTTYFCKVFKKNVGKTIGEYRKENLKAESGGRIYMSKTSEKMRAEWKANDAIRDSGLVTPADIERVDDIQYGPDAKWNKLDVYRPIKEKEKMLPVIVSIHGGGWVYGDKELYQFYCMSLAQRGFAVVNFSYRLAPEHKFPAQMEDINMVIQWIYENGREYQFDMNHIFMVGDSAGAHLLGLYLAVCTSDMYAANYRFKVPEGFVPKAVALNCGAYEPFAEGALSYESLTCEARETIERNKDLMEDLLPDKGSEKERTLISVLHHINESFPPVYLMTAAGDFCMDQAPRLEEKLKEYGVYYEYRLYGDKDAPLYHVFHLTMQEPEGQRCNDEECDFFRRMMLL